MTPEERLKIKVDLINFLPVGFQVKDLSSILREVAGEIDEVAINLFDDEVTIGDDLWMPLEGEK